VSGKQVGSCRRWHALNGASLEVVGVARLVQGWAATYLLSLCKPHNDVLTLRAVAVGKVYGSKVKASCVSC
jgi:hypothetical protein